MSSPNSTRENGIRSHTRLRMQEFTSSKATTESFSSGERASNASQSVISWITRSARVAAQCSSRQRW